MPLGTWTRETRPWPHSNDQQRTYQLLVGDPALWQPLLDELAAEITQRQQARQQTLREHPDFAPFMAPLPNLPKPEFYPAAAGEYVCEHCGDRFLGLHLRGNERVRVCSNRCELAHRGERRPGRAECANIAAFRSERRDRPGAFAPTSAG
jgi:hypothetical protein